MPGRSISITLAISKSGNQSQQQQQQQVQQTPTTPITTITTPACLMFSTPYFVLTFSLLLTLPILLLLAPHFLPPSATTTTTTAADAAADDLDDLSLFSRASTTTTTNPSLKIAFLFLTNTELHFAPLWDRFFSTSPNPSLFNIYIHADPSSNVSSPPASKFFLPSRFIPAKPTLRASPTLIAATRRLIAAALLDDPANSFFALVSQHCVPLHSFPYLRRSLLLSTTFDRSAPPIPPSLLRLNLRPKPRSYVEILSNSKSLWKRYSSRGKNSMLPEVPFDKFRVGSQFFVLARRHALLVLKDRRLWKKFRAPCRRPDECYPEEHYFPTLLDMADHDGCTRYSLTKVNWTGTTNGHPYTYGPEEISPELIYQLRESNYSESYLFARKFSPACLGPLMDIADKVILRD